MFPFAEILQKSVEHILYITKYRKNTSYINFEAMIYYNFLAEVKNISKKKNITLTFH
jgi:hypothetical protein